MPKNDTQYGIKEPPVKQEGDVNYTTPRTEDPPQDEMRLGKTLTIDSQNGVLEKRIFIDDSDYTALIQDRFIYMDSATSNRVLTLIDLPDYYGALVTVHEANGSNLTTVKDEDGNTVGQVFNSTGPNIFTFFGGTWHKVQ